MARTASTLPFSGAKLRRLRERKGWFQKDLCAQAAEAGCKITRSQISLYETGAAVPSPPTFRLLVDILGCAEDALLDDETDAA